jgi:hypothetical protein
VSSSTPRKLPYLTSLIIYLFSFEWRVNERCVLLKINRCVFIKAKKICLFVFNLIFFQLWAVVTGFKLKNQLKNDITWCDSWNLILLKICCPLMSFWGGATNTFEKKNFKSRENFWEVKGGHLAPPDPPSLRPWLQCLMPSRLWCWDSVYMSGAKCLLLHLHHKCCCLTNRN